MAIEIVDLTIKNGDFPELFVCLPGVTNQQGRTPTRPTSDRPCRSQWLAQRSYSEVIWDWDRLTIHQNMGEPTHCLVGWATSGKAVIGGLLVV